MFYVFRNMAYLFIRPIFLLGFISVVVLPYSTVKRKRKAYVKMDTDSRMG